MSLFRLAFLVGLVLTACTSQQGETDATGPAGAVLYLDGGVITAGKAQFAGSCRALIALIALGRYRARMAQQASITIRRLDPRLKRKLRLRAAVHGRSMEEEAREILRVSLATDPRASGHLADTIRRIAASVGYFDDLKTPSRQLPRAPPEFK